MKKVAGVLFSVVLASVLLTGCYTKSCNQPVAGPYKGDTMQG